MWGIDNNRGMIGTKCGISKSNGGHELALRSHAYELYAKYIFNNRLGYARLIDVRVYNMKKPSLSQCTTQITKETTQPQSALNTSTGLL